MEVTAFLCAYQACRFNRYRGSRCLCCLTPMFSLTITLISIVLVVAFVAAVVYYGGGSFTGGAARAEAVQLVGEAAQIRSAAIAHKANTQNFAVDVGQLVAADYLRSPPSNWIAHEEAVAVYDVRPDVCEKVNAQFGITGIPSCSTLTTEQNSACCELAD